MDPSMARGRTVKQEPPAPPGARQQYGMTPASIGQTDGPTQLRQYGGALISVGGRKEGGKVILTDRNLVFVFARPPEPVVALRSIDHVETDHDDIVLMSADAELARFGIFEREEREAWVKAVEDAMAIAEQKGEPIQQEQSEVPAGPGGAYTESLLPGIDAGWVATDGIGKVLTIKSSTPLEVEAVTVGAGCIQFIPIQYGGSIFTYPPRFAPFFTRSHAAQCSQSDGAAEPGSFTEVELDESFPTSGIVVRQLAGLHGMDFFGSIHAPAVKLDLHDGREIWIYHLWSGPRTFEYRLEKSGLAVTHGSSGVSASVTGEANGDLVLETAFNGTGYVRASFTVRRELDDQLADKKIWDVENETTRGEEAVKLNRVTTWRPIFRSFDFLLVCDLKMSADDFIYALSRFVQIEPVNPGKTLGEGGTGHYVISDGADIKYTLTMTGYRRIYSDDDQVGMSLA